MAKWFRSRARGLATRVLHCSVWFIAVVIALPQGAEGAATYYFSSSGNDALGNGTMQNPWQSVARFNALKLNPGDAALFRAGDQFSGKMYLDANDSGLSATGQLIAPIKIGSYGATGSTTRARFVSPYNSEGFQAFNTGGIELSDLDFISGGFSNSSRKDGVDFLIDQTTSTTRSSLSHIRVNNVSTQGFGLNGLRVWAHNSLGYNDVKVTNSEFSNNGYAGVYVGATQWHGLQHSNVVIDRVAAHNNPGFSSPELLYTGHGILLAQTNGGAIQNSVAYDNGKAFGNGNAAMWTYQSNAVTIQGNLAFGNRSVGQYDGAAYDIDGGSTNVIVQYNRSYDNDGAGMLLAQFQNSDPMTNNVFRYNLSVNDGRRNYGGISIFGHDADDLAEDTVFHNNTVVTDRNVVPNSKGPVWFMNGSYDDLAFINNSFVALNGAPLISGTLSPAKAAFAGNSYWTDGGRIVMGSVVYPSIETWAQFRGQEKVGGVFVGQTSDPRFVDTGAYQVHGDSPLLGAGLAPGVGPWPSWLSSVGPRDLGGIATYQQGALSIGAREFMFGDLDGNGQVDSNDLTILKTFFGASGSAAAWADLNGDGRTDGGDFLVWQRLFGSGGYVAINAGGVPEPGALALVAPLVLAALVRRRRKSVLA